MFKQLFNNTEKILTTMQDMVAQVTKVLKVFIFERGENQTSEKIHRCSCPSFPCEKTPRDKTQKNKHSNKEAAGVLRTMDWPESRRQCC